MITRTSHFFHTLFSKFFGNQFSKEGFLLYANNLQWITVLRIGTIIISLVTTMAVARLLGPNLFGILNYVLSISGLFAVVASLGASNIVYRELIKHKDEREDILGTGMFLTFLSACVAIILMLSSLLFFNESRYINTLVIVMSISFLLQPLTLLGFDFQKDSQSKYTTIAQIITLILSSIGKIFLVYFYNSVFMFLVVLVLENLILGIIYIYQIKHVRKLSIKFTVSKTRLRYFFLASLPLTFMLAFNELYGRIDQIMLRHYIDIKTVGLYSAATKLTEIWYILPNILISGLFPAFVNASINSRQEYRKRFFIITKILLITSGIICLLMYTINPYIITIIYGAEFLPAATILSIYIFSLPGSFLSALILQELFLDGKYTYIVLLPASIAAINIIMNIYLIPIYGAPGAAFATVVSYNLVPVLFYALKKIKVL